ncbi:CDN_1a_G0051220.mRNA.1.CDS.1 [Saccharomyces cerevisiae]|nr:Tpo4p [Saccharomyces cerevisiae YJM554]AJT81487.1 Tpo4p [Saccharomyces cerevisiae YJM683]AJT89341.1 Tpo4p [Saccharomyces cerevisiae YJM1199]AJT89821.1 Tpo4p [Saccharomyces cerevisiae YJM1202]AJU08351.1 Tpo4p [Saccharomyces cerevisiae YJM1444]CAI4799660.1 CCC_1a_G0051260.mRNA.1.CDS.1 [Saccharomyces cerevisiae]
MPSSLTKTESNSDPRTNIQQVPKALDKNVTNSGNLDSTSSSTGSITEDEKRSESNADSNNMTGGEPIDPRDLDWDGPDDPDNPHNWSSLKKWYTTMTSAFLCLVVTMGSSLYVSSVPELVERYHVSQTLALAGLTFYLLGLSTVIGAPLSEVFGRKPVYLFSLPVSMLFTMGVGLSNGHMRIILPLRFLSGVFASPALSVGSGTILDIFDVDQVSVAMTYFVLSPFLGPVLSPIMAGFATEAKGWRWSEWIQLIAGGLILPFIALMPETHKGIILRKRAKKRNIALKKFSREAQKEFLKTTVTITILRPLKMLVVEPIVFVFSVYVAFIFAILFGFFEAYAVIYRGVYHMSMGISGLPFIGIGVGLWIGAFFYLYIDRKYLFPKPPAGTQPLTEKERTSKRTTPYRGARDAETGELLPVVPEKFLIACKFGSVALPIGLFWQAWTARSDVHWMAPVAAGVPFGFGLILIFFSVLMYFSTCYPPLTMASCLAANNLLRYVMSSVFPLFTIQMYTKMKIKWASTLFALVCVVMIPIPWVFEKWGSKLRHKSQFGYAAMEKEAETEGDIDDVNAVDGELNLTRMTTLRTMETDPSTREKPGERLSLRRTHTQPVPASFDREGGQHAQNRNEPISNSLYSAIKDNEDGYSYTEMATDASARMV